MGFLEDLSLETKRRRKKYPKKYAGFKRYKFYEIRPLSDILKALEYQFANVLYNTDVCLIMAKKYKGNMYKYTVIYDLEKYKALRITDELLVSYNLGREFEHEFKLEELGKIPTIDVVICDNTMEDSVKYSILNTKYEAGKYYRVGLCYDVTYHILLQFMQSKEIGEMYSNFKWAVYHDIGAKDVEDV